MLQYCFDDYADLYVVDGGMMEIRENSSDELWLGSLNGFGPSNLVYIVSTDTHIRVHRS